MSIRALLLALACCILPAAAPPPAAPPSVPSTPQLRPGEDLALAGPDGQVHQYGDAARETPMGGMAKFVWLSLEGTDWGSMDLRFRCTGSWEGHACWKPKGHGKVDLDQAVQSSCTLAFLAWGRMSAALWKHDYGDGPGRVRMEQAFEPFLGRRMPPGDGIPEITPAWVGDGDLLRASPVSMVRWLQDPAQDAAVRLIRRCLTSFSKYVFETGSWWVSADPAPGAEGPGAGPAWAAGSDGEYLAVLRVPAGLGPAAAEARFRELMHIPKD
jgi:hypothetical protein